ncbi:Acetoin utilization deacetylase AcuC [Roseivivax lentus]|uniref:Acetoin utilization deacetylase AcuC n=1 Tax=Roseivivax lentus TaxID=633194 RepID=A0A1N7K0M6_9RHOB|nr:histone deacetylase family protein [Roseivivax lentus]SIS55149.1 Acetoin utilization deacetylase AcuC [Roseivivax lentus]
MATALITHDAALRHVTPDGHPERVARIEHLLHALAGFDLVRVAAQIAGDEEIERCHPASYIGSLERHAPSRGFHQVDGDTFLSPGSLEAARRGVGGVVEAVDMVVGGKVGNAFVAMRPPGHHAERQTAMGFCFFGNAAIGAKYALDVLGLSRVAVVDFDVHHGNGTQDLLWHEKRTLFVSSHQSPLWPGSGEPHETGAHDNVLNVPLPPGSDGARMRAVYEDRVFPRLRAFEPELVILSAGFDAHRADPLANLDWETEDFAWVTEQLCAIAAEVCGGRVVSTLEGGYDLQALSEAGAAHVTALMEAGR